MNYFVDTNYFLRWFLNDNNSQFYIVEKIFRDAMYKNMSLYSNTLVFFEVACVLQSVYKVDKNKLLEYLEAILNLPVIFEEKDILDDSLRLFRTHSIQIQDCYSILFALSHSNSPLDFASFDKKLIKVFKTLV